MNFYSITWRRPRRAQQVPELNNRPAPVGTQSPLAWLTHFEFTRNKTNRRHVTVDLGFYQETTPGVYTGFYPATLPADRLTFRFDINIQRLPELNRFPGTAYFAPNPAWETRYEKTQNHTNRVLRTVHLSAYQDTSPEFYRGFYPGSAGVESYRISFKRRHITVELNEYPATPIPIAPSIPGIEYTIDEGRLHYTVLSSKLHYEL